ECLRPLERRGRVNQPHALEIRLAVGSPGRRPPFRGRPRINSGLTMHQAWRQRQDEEGNKARQTAHEPSVQIDDPGGGTNGSADLRQLTRIVTWRLSPIKQAHVVANAELSPADQEGGTEPFVQYNGPRGSERAPILDAATSYCISRLRLHHTGA